MTIKEALKLGHTKTKSALDNEVLLSFVLKKPKEFLYTNPEKTISKKTKSRFKHLLSQRAKGMPVAYLAGQKEFFGLKFKVNKSVLIPRPETETLVELVISIIKKKKTVIRILDVGTGSGNIIISLAKALNNFSTRLLVGQARSKNIVRAKQREVENQFFASDISEKALKIAKANAKEHNVKINFKQGTLLKPWKKQDFDIIVANLPYLAKLTHPSTKQEPKQALLAKKNGLALYEELFRQLSSLREARSFDRATKQSLPRFVFVEFDPSQTKQLKKLANKYLPTFKQTVYKDLSGKNRFLLFTKAR